MQKLNLFSLNWPLRASVHILMTKIHHRATKHTTMTKSYNIMMKAHRYIICWHDGTVQAFHMFHDSYTSLLTQHHYFLPFITTKGYYEVHISEY